MENKDFAVSNLVKRTILKILLGLGYKTSTVSNLVKRTILKITAVTTDDAHVSVT